MISGQINDWSQAIRFRLVMTMYEFGTCSHCITELLSVTIIMIIANSTLRSTEPPWWLLIGRPRNELEFDWRADKSRDSLARQYESSCAASRPRRLRAWYVTQTNLFDYSSLMLHLGAVFFSAIVYASNIHCLFSYHSIILKCFM